jgi:hypothetical protein
MPAPAINSDNETILYPAFLVILLVTGNIGRGVLKTGKTRQIEITENGFFY